MLQFQYSGSKGVAGLAVSYSYTRSRLRVEARLLVPGAISGTLKCISLLAESIPT